MDGCINKSYAVRQTTPPPHPLKWPKNARKYKNHGQKRRLLCVTVRSATQHRAQTAASGLLLLRIQIKGATWYRAMLGLAKKGQTMPQSGRWQGQIAGRHLAWQWAKMGVPESLLRLIDAGDGLCCRHLRWRKSFAEKV